MPPLLHASCPAIGRRRAVLGELHYRVELVAFAINPQRGPRDDRRDAVVAVCRLADLGLGVVTPRFTRA
jgi:hypothetical protein